MSREMMVMNGRQNRYPFTASQWMELEHQAIIFKCMASGHPIPSDLILHIRRSILLDSISSSSSVSASLFFPHQHPNNNNNNSKIGWGYGRKVEDPEPGRCRRTDGKKWRCSKAAHPDSKYCERHMLRGKSRSRKPVETPRHTTITSSNHQVSISSMENTNNPHHLPFYPYCYPRPPPGSSSTSTEKSERDLRYFHGMGGDETERYSASLSFTPLGMSSLGVPKLRSPLSSTYLHQQQQDLTKEGYMVSGQEEEKQQQQHCFVLGADLKLLETPSKEHHHDSKEEESSFSNTQLSISTPIFN